MDPCVQNVKELLVSGRESNPDYTGEGNVQPPFRSFFISKIFFLLENLFIFVVHSYNVFAV